MHDLIGGNSYTGDLAYYGEMFRLMVRLMERPWDKESTPTKASFSVIPKLMIA